MPHRRGGPKGNTWYYFDLGFLQDPCTPKQERAANTVAAFKADLLSDEEIVNGMVKEWAEADLPFEVSVEERTVSVTWTIDARKLFGVIDLPFGIGDKSRTVQKKFRLATIPELPKPTIDEFLDQTEQTLLQAASGRKKAQGLTVSETDLVEVMFDRIHHAQSEPQYAPGKYIEFAPFLNVGNVTRPNSSDDGSYYPDPEDRRPDRPGDGSGSGGGNGGGSSVGGNNGGNNEPDNDGPNQASLVSGVSDLTLVTGAAGVATILLAAASR